MGNDPHCSRRATLLKHMGILPPLSVTSDLLGHEPEALVGPVALVGLPQDGVEGFTSCPVVAGGVRRHGKGGHVDLRQDDRQG